MATEKKTANETKDRFDRQSIPHEPNWWTGDLGVNNPIKETQGPVKGPVQQSDIFKPLLEDIAKNGLSYAYHKYIELEHHAEPRTKTKFSRHVIIVGAGMAGLVAAYELAQAGHKVTILEQQTRFGGRVKTFGEMNGFAKGLHVDAGAMRLPCKPDDPEKTHYLTDHYAKQFELELLPFVNYDDNAFLQFYEMKPVRFGDWKDEYFGDLWPGWDERIIATGAACTYDIKNIDDYYNHTTSVVTDQLRKWLGGSKSWICDILVWMRWTKIWSQFPLNGFLESTYDAVLSKVHEEGDNREGLEKLADLLPWPRAAITAYSVYSYTEQLDQSLVQYLRDQLGNWWSKHMHRIKGGMSKLPEAFTKPNEHGWNKDVHIHDCIHFNRTVNEIVYTYNKCDYGTNKVEVKGFFSNSGQPFQPIEGDAVIVTTPVNILRQVSFMANPKSIPETPSPPRDFYKAIEDIWTGPSTKIMIQTKTRFWECKYNIRGGFSKTNLPIGQIHYPSNPDCKSIPGDKGILLVYTWKSEALMFGSLHPHVAVREAVEQIATIHPEIKGEFEVGAVQAWYNEPSAQGAYCLLKPHQIIHVEWLKWPMCNVYFAGEAISSASGWIQGALESGLRAAFQFFLRNEFRSALN